MTREQVFIELKRRGIARVEVSFSGGGDEGGADRVIGLDKNGKQIENWIPWNAGTDQILVDALQIPIEEEYDGFGGDFQVYGKLIWIVRGQKVRMEGKETEYVPFKKIV